MRVWVTVLLVLVVPRAGATSFAQPPWPGLSPEAIVQIATAVDGERPDEPALYPLLLHMRRWTRDDFDRSGAAILADGLGHRFDRPDGYRGALFGLEGRFAGRVREVELLRGGPWGRSVTEWGLVADGPKDAGGRVAVVYFPGAVARPRDRQRVRVAGRFFKLWTDVDAAGVETSYPVFVAAPFWEPAGGTQAGAGWRGMVVLVAGLTAGLWAVRRGLRRAKSEKRAGLVRSSGRMGKSRAADDDEVEDSLPEDPAEALGVLHDRRGGADAGFPSARE